MNYLVGSPASTRPCLYFLFFIFKDIWIWLVPKRQPNTGLKKKNMNATKEKWSNVPLMISGSYETRVIFNPLPVTITFTIRVCLQHNNHVHRVTFHEKKASRKVGRGTSHLFNINWSVFVLLHGSRDIKSTWHQISRQRLRFTLESLDFQNSETQINIWRRIKNSHENWTAVL